MRPLQSRSTGRHRPGNHDVVDRLMLNVQQLRDQPVAGVAAEPRLLKDTAMDRQIRLADGRQVNYCEYGAAGGFPVLALHGTPGSRLKYAAANADAAQMGLRI